jgi:hypothetical protein
MERNEKNNVPFPHFQVCTLTFMRISTFENPYNDNAPIIAVTNTPSHKLILKGNIGVSQNGASFAFGTIQVIPVREMGFDRERKINEEYLKQ